MKFAADQPSGPDHTVAHAGAQAAAETASAHTVDAMHFIPPDRRVSWHLNSPASNAHLFLTEHNLPGALAWNGYPETAPRLEQ
jgi:hypothetical protein